MSYNRYCEKCGSSLEENTCFCSHCGNKIVNDSFNENLNQSVDYGGYPPAKRGNKKVWGTIGSVALIVVCSFLGKFLGTEMTEDMSTNKQMANIDSFVESMQEYTPGFVEGEEFYSSHFNLKFIADENWILYTDEELKPFTENIRESTVRTGLASLDEQGVSQELKDKWEDAVYVETEMGACFVDEDLVVGEITFAVMSAYGADDATTEDFHNETIKQFSAIADDVVSGHEMLAGENYSTISAKVVIEGMNMTNKIYIRVEDGMLCMITCKALDGYETDMMESFLSNVEEYK